MISTALRPKISPSIKPLLPDGGMYMKTNKKIFLCFSEEGSGLTDAATSEQTQTYLLASKSNYTHLLEGTLLPGVSYPESLSSGLTSKRTSHKIAEQGRRNRINEALKEMQSLLPLPAVRKKSNKDGESPDVDGSDEKADDEESKDETPAASVKGKNKESRWNSKGSPNGTVGGKTSVSGSSAAAEAKAANSKAATVESAIVYIKELQQERVVMAEKMVEKDKEVNELRKRLREVELKLNSPHLDGKAMEADVDETNVDETNAGVEKEDMRS